MLFASPQLRPQGQLGSLKLRRHKAETLLKYADASGAVQHNPPFLHRMGPVHASLKSQKVTSGQGRVASETDGCFYTLQLLWEAVRKHLDKKKRLQGVDNILEHEELSVMQQVSPLR